MASKKAILVGGWAAFSDVRGLTKKEEPETFGWMSEENTFFYNDMRAALDSTPGSRDFLCPSNPRIPIVDPLWMPSRTSCRHCTAARPYLP